MSAKRILAYMTAGCMTAVMFGGMQLSASATKGPETGVYLSDTMLVPNQYMSETQEVMEGEQVIGENGCVAHFSNDGVLSLYGTMTLDEVSGDDRWGAIGGAVGASDLTIKLLDGADYTLNSAAYSGIYGNYEPVRIEGNGKLTINTSGASNGGIVVYGKDGSAESVPTGVTITDGAEVTITGMKGVVLQGNADGDISVTDGAVLTVDTQNAAFSKAPVIEEGSLVTVGASAAETAEWDGSTPLTSYNYVRIAAPGESSEEPTEPEETPTPLDIKIGDKMLTDEDMTWESNGVTASYDIDSDTLTLSGTGTIDGSAEDDAYGCGAAISAHKKLNIVVAENADITLNAGKGSGSWVCGIYTDGADADITIGGAGKLTVNSTSDAANAIAICPYVRHNDDEYNLTLKGSVDVTANGGAYGVYTYLEDKYDDRAGWIQITDSASFAAKGTKNAVRVTTFQDSYIYGGGRSFIGTVDDGAWDASKVKNATSISIKPVPAIETETSKAMTGNDSNTGFVTVINGTAGTTIRNISWEIKTSTETRTRTPETQPNITLDEDAQAVFAVIVEGLSDANATATAIVQ